MAQLIEASRDFAALERLMPLYIERAASQAESGLAARRKAQRVATAVNPERIRAITEMVGPEIPFGIELWIGHLGHLDQASGAVQFSMNDLSADECRGLALLRRVREKYWSEHASCSVCQSVNLRSASFCGGCGKEFK